MPVTAKYLRRDPVEVTPWAETCGGVKHKAIGKLTVLTVCIPRGVLNDVHELE
jgi:hypothetical protein